MDTHLLQLRIVDGQDMSILTGKSHLKDFGPLQCLSILQSVILFHFNMFHNSQYYSQKHKGRIKNSILNSRSDPNIKRVPAKHEHNSFSYLGDGFGPGSHDAGGRLLGADGFLWARRHDKLESLSKPHCHHLFIKLLSGKGLTYVVIESVVNKNFDKSVRCGPVPD